VLYRSTAAVASTHRITTLAFSITVLYRSTAAVASTHRITTLAFSITVLYSLQQK